MILVVCITVSFALPTFADSGATGYKIIHEDTGLMGLVRVTISNVHTNYMGSTHGTRAHTNINIYAAGVEVANFHVWETTSSGGNKCVVVFESHSGKTVKKCNSTINDAISDAVNEYSQEVANRLPTWAIVAGVVGAVVLSVAISLIVKYPVIIPAPV